jgi:squalene-hopene/tetraprenyl-beta-curcumene cyclase
VTVWKRVPAPLQTEQQACLPPVGGSFNPMRNDFAYILPGTSGQSRVARLEARDQKKREDERLVRTAALAATTLTRLQHAEGYWCGNLTADSTLNSDYVLLTLWMHAPDETGWNPPNLARIRKAVRTILDRQLPDGGWNIYEEGPSDINATVRAYAALKVAGTSTEDPAMQKARTRALALGGLQAANSYTKINFSLFGLFPRKYVPSIPPEMLLVPGNVLYEMSSWTRAIIVPLSIVQAAGGVRPTPHGINVDELCVPRTPMSLPKRDAVSLLFHQVDRVVKVWERRGIADIRSRAIRAAEKWMLDHMQFSDGVGAIYPGMMYAIMAMEALGYESDHPDLVRSIREFESLILETDEGLEFQPCVSPVWDTAISMFALGEAGQADPNAMQRGADWLLDKEIRRKGDWSVKRPDLRPSGWPFEFANEFYPDIDDTAMVLLALEHTKASDPQRQARAEARATEWLLGMQSQDGGWAAFDVDNNWSLLNKVPFADHNAMLDPTCPDITGRVIEALCRRGLSYEHPSIGKAVQYLLNQQHDDGSWYGRWGVNYVYGTFLAMRGLGASGSPLARPAIERGASWLMSVQNADGGWGESCAGYVHDRFVAAQSTPSQTAWALLGLAAGDQAESAFARKGLRWLAAAQKADGSWDEKLTTGTGFPGVFYLSYHLYRHYFPLLALATYGYGTKAGAKAARSS